MLVLIDNFTESIHSLGSLPLDAIFAFCDHIKKGVGHPEYLKKHVAHSFIKCVKDGTDADLFKLIEHFQESVQKADHERMTPRVPFELRVVPRPPCRSCLYWKGHGVYCETGCDMQTAMMPACVEWKPKPIAWETLETTTPPEHVYKNALDVEVFAYVANNHGPVSVKEIERKFAQVESKVIHAAIQHLCDNDWLSFGEDRQRYHTSPDQASNRWIMAFTAHTKSHNYLT